ncbi:hypothetical protein KSX_05630 [Ktedonospora formicarum]|uniref:Leucine-binding protein domain-containing protein n=2 Tax=Ktedonospora formicarum TaxID=2778364 RepID=A0A8J3MNY9_9CHLR|nr:hypothetical protein KSX_05630 [Ktedonospora formicarum]
MTTLHAALVTPLTGPLSLYGKTCASALNIWAKKAAILPTNFSSVALDVYDCSTNFQKGLQAALTSQPDVLFGPYGSGPMLKVAYSCTRLIWNHSGASSRLARPSFPHVINILSPASTYFASILQAITSFDPTARRAVLLHSTTGFGQDVARGTQQEAALLGLNLTTAYFSPSHALASIANIPSADILLVVGNFADERAVAPLLRSSRRWRYIALVGAGVDEVLEPLGELREGLIGPAQWVARTALSPDEGPDAQWFASQYAQTEGSEPPYAAAQAFASGIVYARCLRETTTTRDEDLLSTAQKLQCRTLFGEFQLDPISGLQVGHQMAVVQWQQGQRRVIWPPEQAERPLMPSNPRQ